MNWLPREPPLAACAVAAWGDVAHKLQARASGRLGVRSEQLLLIVGDDLPWVDGVVYLGRDPAAPKLLLPTVMRPDVPVDLLERALLHQFSEATPPLAVLGDQVVAVGHARLL